MTVIEVLKSVPVVFAWGLLAFILPRELKRHALINHYRQWVKQRAYWGRPNYNWIVDDLVFHTDQYWEMSGAQFSAEWVHLSH